MVDLILAGSSGASFIFGTSNVVVHYRKEANWIKVLQIALCAKVLLSGPFFGPLQVDLCEYLSSEGTFSGQSTTSSVKHRITQMDRIFDTVN